MKGAEERAEERAEGEGKLVRELGTLGCRGESAKAKTPHETSGGQAEAPSDALLACQLGTAGFGRSQWTKSMEAVEA